MKRALWALPPVVALVVLFAVGFRHDPSSVPSPLVAKSAPAFHLRTPHGRAVSLGSLKGRPLVINFFASWCVACHTEQPAMVRAYQRWHRRVTFLGVIFEDSTPAATSWLRSTGSGWPALVDPSGQMAVDYGVTGVPETFFIDPRGKIVHKTLYLTPARLRTGIDRILRRA